MSEDYAITLVRQAVQLGVELSLPVLVASLLAGLVVSFIQAATQINEATLTFLPKVTVVGAVLWIVGPTMLDRILSFTTYLLTSLPQVAHQ